MSVERDSSKGISAEKLKDISTSSGVYLMKDSKGRVVYVGKAKNLKGRIESYFKGRDERHRVVFLLERVESIDTIITETERQALVLERELIRKYKPRYNVRLKDDKSYLSVRVDLDSDWPRLELVHRPKDDSARYVGPFAFAHEVRALMDIAKRVFPLRSCSDRMLRNRVRPCLEYQIKRCAAPCCLDVDPVEYRSWVERALDLLEGRNDEVELELEARMKRASEELRFEDAAAIRDRLGVLRSVREESSVGNYSEGSIDAFAIYGEGARAEVSLLQVRRGRLLDARSFSIEEAYLPDEEILAMVLGCYYEEGEGGQQPGPVDEILLSVQPEDSELRAEMLGDLWGRRPRVSVPLRGAKLRLIRLAEENARENFQARFGRIGEKTLLELKGLLELDEDPRTIECVDISHIQGSASVGVVVCFDGSKPLKSRYRRYHLQSRTGGDDLAAMGEVLERHLSREMEEGLCCDLLIVDGGPGQLGSAIDVRRNLGADRPRIVALAKRRSLTGATSGRSAPVNKGRERLYLEAKNGPLFLDRSTRAHLLLERIRDEAHRFAIGCHRELRSRGFFHSALDDITGVGPKRRVALLREFSSAREIGEALPEDIAEKCSIPLEIARRIVNALKALT